MYAGIKSISPELREAAQIDGATEGQVSRHIIIPMLVNYQSLFNFCSNRFFKGF